MLPRSGFYLSFEKNKDPRSVDEYLPEAFAGPPEACRMERFATIVNGFSSLTTVVKLFILDVCKDPGCA